MKLTNNWINTIFWRTFNVGDTVYVVGHREGSIGQGLSAEITHPHGEFQIEIKRESGFLTRAGKKWNNDDELVVTEQGELHRVEELVHVEQDAEQSQRLATITQFIDRRNFPSDTTDEITTVLSQETTTSTGSSVKVTSSSSAENQSSGNGKVSGNGEINGIKLGVEFGGSVSQKITQATIRELSANQTITNKEAGSISHKRSIPLKGGTVTAITWVWMRYFRAGHAVVGPTRYPFEVTTRVVASDSKAQYASISDMPPHVFNEFRQQFPDSSQSFLRIGEPCLVDGNGWLGLFRVDTRRPNGSISGTVYGDQFHGSWTATSGRLQFVRSIHSDYLQHWDGGVLNGDVIQGKFQQEIAGNRETSQYNFRLASRLRVVGNGHAGELRITALDAAGRLTGTLYGDAISGTWNQSSGTLVFTRSTSRPNYSQRWTGQRMGELTFSGWFTELHNDVPTASDPTHQGAFSWTATAA